VGVPLTFTATGGGDLFDFQSIMVDPMSSNRVLLLYTVKLLKLKLGMEWN
jgi:hypothetical protein